MPRRYYTASVCEAGHIITDAIELSGDDNAYCEECGAKAVTKCPSCGIPLKGSPKEVLYVPSYTPPNFCFSCGHALPWYAAAIDNARRIAEDAGLTQEEAEDVATTMGDLANDNSGTELAASRILRYAKKAGNTFGGMLIRIATDIGCKTAVEFINRQI